MEEFKELKEKKAVCLEDLTVGLPWFRKRLEVIDGRLVEYVEDAVSNGGSHANLYELLGIRKVLRLMDSYDLDVERVRRKIGRAHV